MTCDEIKSYSNNVCAMYPLVAENCCKTCSTAPKKQCVDYSAADLEKFFAPSFTKVTHCRSVNLRANGFTCETDITHPNESWKFHVDTPGTLIKDDICCATCTKGHVKPDDSDKYKCAGGCLVWHKGLPRGKPFCDKKGKNNSQDTCEAYHTKIGEAEAVWCMAPYKKGVETRVGKDCNDECGDLNGQDQEDCMEECWDNEDKVGVHRSKKKKGVETRVGDCNDECGDLNGQDQEDCMEICWENEDKVGGYLRGSFGGDVVFYGSVLVLVAGSFFGGKYLAQRKTNGYELV